MACICLDGAPWCTVLCWLAAQRLLVGSTAAVVDAAELFKAPSANGMVTLHNRGLLLTPKLPSEDC